MDAVRNLRVDEHASTQLIAGHRQRLVSDVLVEILNRHGSHVALWLLAG